MINLEMKVEGNTLTITADLSKTAGLSKTGKTIIIATTSGNVSVAGHKGIKVGVNIYKARVSDP